MKGIIKYAKVSIKYEVGKKQMTSYPVKTILVIYPGEKKIYNKNRVIDRIKDELKLKKAKNIKIKSVKILADLGKTNYEI